MFRKYNQTSSGIIRIIKTNRYNTNNNHHVIIRCSCINNEARRRLLLINSSVLSSSSSSSISHNIRYFSSSNNNKDDNKDNDDDNPKFKIPPKPSLDDINTKEYLARHSGIKLHQYSIGNYILPGNIVLVDNRHRKVIQKRYTELVYGYFWMLKDLQRCNDKPILSNQVLISEKECKLFPKLSNVIQLSGNNKNITFPDYFVRKNRSHDISAQCTIVAISFRDFGYQQIQSWLAPYRNELLNDDNDNNENNIDNYNDRIEIITLNVSYGWINKYILGNIIQYLTKWNTPPEEHDNTFLYYSTGNAQNINDPIESMRDVLRMHNIMIGYIFLLDGLGQVRYAACGTPTNDEIQKLIELSKELLNSDNSSSNDSPSTSAKSSRYMKHKKRISRK